MPGQGFKLTRRNETFLSTIARLRPGVGTLCFIHLVYPYALYGCDTNWRKNRHYTH
jgi:hypothetical protein